MIERLLSDREVAQLIGRARSTLQRDRSTGIGIPFIYVRGQVRYRESDIQKYIAGLSAPRSTREAIGPGGADAA
jgi:predicted DNA-binding transcriptional regulator AlpA